MSDQMIFNFHEYRQPISISDMSKVDQDIYKLLHKGAQYATPCNVLADIVGVDQRTVISSISRLRNSCLFAIGSSRGENNGYYLISDANEFQNTLKQLEHGKRSLERTINSLQISDFAKTLDVDFIIGG